LNGYFDAMCEVCTFHNACIDKFIGDGMMIIFGIEGSGSGARESINCAFDMLEALHKLNKKYSDENYPSIKMGIGIHCGVVVAGEIGSSDRRQYTVIGSNVNIAARIESKTKDLPPEFPPIVVTSDVLREAGFFLNAECEQGFIPLEIELRGINSPPKLFAAKDTRIIRSMISKSSMRHDSNQFRALNIPLA
jgi:class 3 adenylate cyclase